MVIHGKNMVRMMVKSMGKNDGEIYGKNDGEIYGKNDGEIYGKK